TVDCLARVLACEASEPHWFRRPGASKVTGHRWDESFALTFLPEHHERLLEVAELVNARVPARKIHMFTLLAAWNGADLPCPVAEVNKQPNQTHIDDWSDDFDSWAEYCQWTGRYYAGKVSAAICVASGGRERWRRDAERWTVRHWRQAGF